MTNVYRLIATIIFSVLGFIHISAAAQVPPPRLFIGGPGTALVPDNFYFSPNRKYFLVFQSTDGNLVVYRVGQATNTAIWSSSSFGGKWAILQNDGNFVIYSSSDPSPSNAVFSTGAGQAGGTTRAYMQFYDDGVFEVVNTSGTIWRTAPVVAPTNPSNPTCPSVQAYPVCFFPGRAAQFNSVTYACSIAEARQQVAQAGAIFGRCPGT
jgi:hypothetical protein